MDASLCVINQGNNMNISKSCVAISVIAMLISFSAHAERMNYAFIELGPQFMDLDDAADADGTGVSLRASWIYGPYAFTDLRIEDTGLDNNIDITNANIRIGARMAYPNLRSPFRLDGYAMLSYEHVDITANNAEVLDDGGLGIALGWRFGPIEEIELGAELNYHDIGDGVLAGVVEGIWNTSDWFAIVLTLRQSTYDLPGGGDLDRQDATLGFRFLFGGDEKHSLRNRGGTWTGGRPGTLD